MIFGRVLDPQSSAVARATIVVTNTNTNTAVTLTTNETGYYEANLLLPGNYRVTAESAGFKKYIRDGLSLAISTRMEIVVNLEMGQLTDAVTVTAAASVLESSSVSTGRILENREVMELPAFNNSPLLLIKLAPGIQSPNVRRYNTVIALGGIGEAHLPGNVGGSDYSIDGVPNLGSGYNAAYLPYSTAIEEYKTETSNFDASAGHTIGATVAIMTKAGTNALHGTLTEQHWQQRWNGARFFVKQQYYRSIAQAEAAGDHTKAEQLRASPMQPSGHSNNYAGTLGGPVVIPKIYDGRNKLFFFFSYDGFQDRKSAESGFIRTLPTMANRSGDFTDLLKVSASRYQIYDPLSVRADTSRPGHYVRDPIAGNIIPRSRMINPAYDTYNKFLPTPNSPPANDRLDPLNNFTGVGEPMNWSYWGLANRVDYNYSDKHRFFGRWSWSQTRINEKDWTYETYPGLERNIGTNRNNRGANLDWVYSRSSRTVIDVVAAVNDFEEGSINDVIKTFKPSSVGLPGYLDAKAGEKPELPTMAFTGYETLGIAYPAFTHYQLASAKVNAFHVSGSHTLRGGMDVRDHMRFGGPPGFTSGNFNFSNTYTSREDDGLTPAGNLGHSWAAFLMGLPSGASIDTNSTFAVSSLYHGWYFQDSWRLTPRLTLNLGVRFEYEWGRIERFDRAVSYFDRNATPAIASLAEAAYSKNPVPELNASGFSVKGGLTYPGVGGVSRRLQSGEFMWMPRLGAAYHVTPKTVIRAGYGIYFDTINAQRNAVNQTGFSQTTSSVLTTNFGMDWLSGDPRRGISPLTDPFPVRGDGTRFDDPVGAGLGSMVGAGRGWSSILDYNLPRARQQRYRVDLQRQLTASMVVGIAYSGSYSDHIGISRKLDPLPANYWATGTVRNDANASNLNQNVANPFYIGNLTALQNSNRVLWNYLAAQSFFASPTMRKSQLLRAFPQMNGLTNTLAPEGKNRVHGLEATFQHRFSKGFSMNVNYMALRERVSNTYYNEFDGSPYWRLADADVPNRLAGYGILELPFGRNKPLARTGIWKALFGGWQVAATYELQPGPLLAWGNLFYYGKLEDINTGQRTLDRWFNTDNFERSSAKGPAAFQRRVFPEFIGGLRADGLNRWDANLQREFKVREQVSVQFRVDMLNLANRAQFAAPNLDPYSTNFGKVTDNTSTTPRFLLFQVRVKF